MDTGGSSGGVGGSHNRDGAAGRRDDDGDGDDDMDRKPAAVPNENNSTCGQEQSAKERQMALDALKQYGVAGNLPSRAAKGTPPSPPPPFSAASAHRYWSETLPDRYRRDKEFVLAVLESWPVLPPKSDFERSFPQSLRFDRDVVLAFVRRPDFASELYYARHLYVPDHLTSDKDVMVAYCRKIPRSLQECSEELCDDVDVVAAAIALDGFELQYASLRLQEHYDIVRTACRSDGRALEFCPPASPTRRLLIEDRDFLVRTVFQTPLGGTMYKLIPDRSPLKRDRELILEALAHGMRFRYCPHEFRQDVSFLYYALQKKPELYLELHKSVQADPDIAKAAILATCRSTNSSGGGTNQPSTAYHPPAPPQPPLQGRTSTGQSQQQPHQQQQQHATDAANSHHDDNNNNNNNNPHPMFLIPSTGSITTTATATATLNAAMSYGGRTTGSTATSGTTGSSIVAVHRKALEHVPSLKNDRDCLLAIVRSAATTTTTTTSSSSTNTSYHPQPPYHPQPQQQQQPNPPPAAAAGAAAPAAAANVVGADGGREAVVPAAAAAVDANAAATIAVNNANDLLLAEILAATGGGVDTHNRNNNDAGAASTSTNNHTEDVEYMKELFITSREEFKDDKEIVLAALLATQHTNHNTKSPKLFSYVSARLRRDPDVLMAAMDCDTALDVLKTVPSNVQLQHPEIVVKAITVLHKRNLRYLRPHVQPENEIWRIPQVAIAWIRRGCRVLEQFQSLLSDPDVAMEIAKHAWPDFVRVSSDLKSDREFMLLAVRHNGRVLRYASTELQTDHALLVRAVASRADALWPGSRVTREQLKAHVDGKLRLQGTFVNDFLRGIAIHVHRSDVPPSRRSQLPLLDKGVETSQAFKKLIAEFLGVPVGEELQAMRTAAEHLQQRPSDTAGRGDRSDAEDEWIAADGVGFDAGADGIGGADFAAERRLMRRRMLLRTRHRAAAAGGGNPNQNNNDNNNNDNNNNDDPAVLLLRGLMDEPPFDLDDDMMADDNNNDVPNPGRGARVGGRFQIMMAFGRGDADRRNQRQEQLAARREANAGAADRRVIPRIEGIGGAGGRPNGDDAPMADAAAAAPPADPAARRPQPAIPNPRGGGGDDDDANNGNNAGQIRPFARLPRPMAAFLPRRDRERERIARMRRLRMGGIDDDGNNHPNNIRDGLDRLRGNNRADPAAAGAAEAAERAALELEEDMMLFMMEDDAHDEIDAWFDRLDA